MEKYCFFRNFAQEIEENFACESFYKEYGGCLDCKKRKCSSSSDYVPFKSPSKDLSKVTMEN